MRLLEVLPLLHRDEGRALRVLHHRDAVPSGLVTEELILDLAHEDDLGSHGGQWAERGVLGVRLAAGQGRLAAIGVLASDRNFTDSG